MTKNMLKIHLKAGREKPIINGHPWIFSGAIQRIEGGGEPGEACRVFAGSGAVLGQGYYNASSSIAVRMLTRGDGIFTIDMLRDRLERAVSARIPILGVETDSCRLVNSEGDFLPGLIVDRYCGGLCVQFLTAGIERMRGTIIDILKVNPGAAFIFERSDTEARQREGLDPHEGLLAGTLPEELVIKENGISFGVDLGTGQKTGFFFDQRVNRLLLREYAAGRRCLDCFSYSGGFALNALAGGAASAVAVDSSREALARCTRHFTINGIDPSRASTRHADIFDYLRSEAAQSDLIILDPPKFASRSSETAKAARGYKDINLLAIKKAAAGGILFTFSCSNAVDYRLFRQIVFAAAADSGREVQLLHVLSAAPDHPVNIAHPQGEYLKGLVLRVV